MTALQKLACDVQGGVAGLNSGLSASGSAAHPGVGLGR
jgi:hypothetical protein